MRRAELLLVALLAAALVAAALAGRRAAPDAALRDPRPSIFLSSPAGARALAETVRRLGVPVVPRRRALFDVADDQGAPEHTVLAFLGLARHPTEPEVAAVARMVGRGGRVLVAGPSGIEHCFGYRFVRSRGAAVVGDRQTTAPAVQLPEIEWTLEEAPPGDPAGGGGGVPPDEPCVPGVPTGLDTLLRTASGKAAAVRLGFRSGGSAILIADAGLVSNRALKETDAGVVVIPWFIAEGTRRVVVDEYHQGFGRTGSLVAVGWRWMLGTPGGWAMLQLLGVGLLALGVAGVRFGPARSLLDRRRRSPLEHLEALAAGLERAGGRSVAVGLLIAGLRRRLSRAQPRRAGEDLGGWLDSLALAARSAEAQAAVRRLARLTSQRRGDEQVLATANAVEDVWEALGPQGRRTPS